MSETKKKYSAWTATKQNKMLYALVCVIIFGYAFFFFSGFLFQDKTEYSVTPLNTPKAYDNSRVFEIVSWDFSESQGLMEVMLEVTNKNFETVDKYKFTGRTKDGNNKLVFTPVLEESGLYVIQISGLKEGWNNLLLQVTLEAENAGTMKLFTSVDEVTYVDKIETKSKNDYYIEKYKNDITLLGNENKTLEKEIAELQEKINNIENANAELKAAQAYQTEAEIDNSNKQISQNETTISTYENSIEDVKQSIDENNAKIGKLNEQIDSLK